MLQLTSAACAAGEGPPPNLASLEGGLDPATARHRLESALRHFDEAAVFTIHGFCNRVLQDNTFESGVYFDTDLVTDINPVVQEVVDDFWMREISRVPLSEYRSTCQGVTAQ